MRTKLTNFLQVIVLITGLVYFFSGIIFYFSPVLFANIFAIEVSEDWLRGIQYDNFIAPLYYFARCFSAMLLVSGLSMILPLYDPLKYRGLVYYTGIVFPLLAFFSLIFSSISIDFTMYNGIKINHMIMAVYSAVFLGIFLLTSIAMFVTKKNAKAGVE